MVFVPCDKGFLPCDKDFLPCDKGSLIRPVEIPYQVSRKALYIKEDLLG